QSKNHLLRPRVASPAFAGKAAARTWNDGDTTPGTYYSCNSHSGRFSDDARAICPNCGRNMTKLMEYVPPPTDEKVAKPGTSADAGGEGGFVKRGVVTYMVMDDLAVAPMSTISSITLLNKYGVKEVGFLEERIVDLDMSKAMRVLRASLHTAMNGELKLKLLVHRGKRKVLFAEADKDVVDFLFSILTLPVGDVVRLLTKRSMVGCLGKLYGSVESLDDAYIEANQSKSQLLNPSVASPAAFSEKAASSGGAGGERGFVKGVVTYMVMDDLAVAPMSTVSSITLLNKRGVKDLGSLEERTARELLKASLQSTTVLTDVFLPKKLRPQLTRLRSLGSRAFADSFTVSFPFM
ncbi:hypothetical protein Taro_054055, partial [Colocasia esculenta]|nr:hypothetical protein [Colocasia esculenta]